MSVQNENASSTGETVVLDRPDAGGVYASLFEKINLKPASHLSDINTWQDEAAMAEADTNERITAGVQDGHTEIYAVDSVTSSSQHTYVPFSSFRHKDGMMRHDAPEYYWHTRVRRGPSGLHNTWLILEGEAFDNHTVPDDESLSLTLTGTNGQLPRRALQSTVLDTVMKTTSASIVAHNLCAPTLPCYPPAQDRFHWRVLSHPGSGFLSMMDNAEVMRGTLALYEWTHSEMNRRRLEAIIDVTHSETERFEQGYLGWRFKAKITLTTRTRLLAVPPLGDGPFWLGMNGVLGAEEGESPDDIPPTFTTEPGYYRGIQPAIPQQGNRRVTYKFD